LFVYYYNTFLNQPDEFYLTYEYRLKTSNGTTITFKNDTKELCSEDSKMGWGWTYYGTGDSIKWLDTAEIFVKNKDTPDEILLVPPDRFVISGRYADYCYDGSTGGLVAIRTDDFTIEGEFLHVEDENTLISRLLNAKTTNWAIIELSARIYGNYYEPWEQPLAICLSAVGGAVIAAVATWLITYFVVRKKRGASALAMVSGDVKKVGGEMPLANGSKTDDFDRS
jgi:hypothetical protein